MEVSNDKPLSVSVDEALSLVANVNELKRHCTSCDASQTDISENGCETKKIKITENTLNESDLQGANELFNSLSSSLSDTTSSSVSQTVDVTQSFAQVCGRLAMMNVVKYPVTIGELARRIHGPEEYSFSLLGSLLRRAKMPHHTENLKTDLEAVGLPLERGRRRSHNLTLFGSLVEGESLQLAKDFKHLIVTEFPVKRLATYTLRSGQFNMSERIHGLTSAIKLLREFLAVIEKDASPICDTYPTIELETDLQMDFTRFSMLTHGFGMVGVRAVLEMFEKYADTQLQQFSSAT